MLTFSSSKRQVVGYFDHQTEKGKPPLHIQSSQLRQQFFYLGRKELKLGL